MLHNQIEIVLMNCGRKHDVTFPMVETAARVIPIYSVYFSGWSIEIKLLDSNVTDPIAVSALKKIDFLRPIIRPPF
jgi:hypothetical protein